MLIVLIDLFAQVQIIFMDLNLKERYPNDIREGHRSTEMVFFVLLMGVQFVTHFCLIFWFFFLVWKTFLFRFSLVKKLLNNLPVLKIIPLNFTLFLVEKGYRCVGTS